MAEPGFWDDQQSAQKLIDETNQLKTKRDNFKTLTGELDDLKVTLELIAEDPAAGMQDEFTAKAEKLKKQLDRYQLGLLLNGKYDHNNAILEIHPGAGGTEAQDWGAMLLRMYTRWQKHMILRLTFWIIKLVKLPELIVFLS